MSPALIVHEKLANAQTKYATTQTSGELVPIVSRLRSATARTTHSASGASSRLIVIPPRVTSSTKSEAARIGRMSLGRTTIPTPTVRTSARRIPARSSKAVLAPRSAAERSPATAHAAARPGLGGVAGLASTVVGEPPDLNVTASAALTHQHMRGDALVRSAGAIFRRGMWHCREPCRALACWRTSRGAGPPCGRLCRRP